MTKEQKLLKLLKIAVENGYSNVVSSSLFEKYDLDVTIIQDKWFSLVLNGQSQSPISLNDLGINFEEGEIGFIEALIKEHHKSKPSEKIGNFFDWIWDFQVGKPRPTSQRLDWLLETFKHLL